MRGRPSVIGLALALALTAPALAQPARPSSPAAPVVNAEAETLMDAAKAAIDADPARARQLMERAATTGYAEALNGLSVFLAQGIGGPKNPRRAASLEEEALRKGSTGALLNVGARLLDEDNPAQQRRGLDYLSRVPQNTPAARVANFLLGRAYLLALGTPEDQARGVDLLERAAPANASNAELLFLLGRAYQNGWGGRTPDPAKAYNHFRRAAELNDPRAQWQLGMALIDGEGIASNLPEAYRWVRRSGEAGYILGQVSTAVMLAIGQGVAENDVEARQWYAKAADQGSAHALRSLGGMLFTAEGGAEDQVTGRAYVELAADAGDEPSKQILERLPAVTAAERREINAAKTAWRAAHRDVRVQ